MKKRPSKTGTSYYNNICTDKRNTNSPNIILRKETFKWTHSRVQRYLIPILQDITIPFIKSVHFHKTINTKNLQLSRGVPGYFLDENSQKLWESRATFTAKEVCFFHRQRCDTYVKTDKACQGSKHSHRCLSNWQYRSELRLVLTYIRVYTPRGLSAMHRRSHASNVTKVTAA